MRGRVRLAQVELFRAATNGPIRVRLTVGNGLRDPSSRVRWMLGAQAAPLGGDDLGITVAERPLAFVSRDLANVDEGLHATPRLIAQVEPPERRAVQPADVDSRINGG